MFITSKHLFNSVIVILELLLQLVGAVAVALTVVIIVKPTGSDSVSTWLLCNIYYLK